MSWQTTMTQIVRGLIFDLTSPYTYTDERIQDIIAIAGTLVISDVDFSYTYTIDVSTPSISPDPATSSDDDFVALVCLKTACIISQGEHRTASRQAFNVKDGPASIDTRSKAEYLGGLANNVCEAYEKAKRSFQIGDGSVGKAIVGPYNAYNSAKTGRGFG